MWGHFLYQLRVPTGREETLRPSNLRVWYRHYWHRCGQWSGRAPAYRVQRSRASTTRAGITPPRHAFPTPRNRAGRRELPGRGRDLPKRLVASPRKPYSERNKFPNTFPSLCLRSAVLPVVQTQPKSEGRWASPRRSACGTASRERIERGSWEQREDTQPALHPPDSRCFLTCQVTLASPFAELPLRTPLVTPSAQDMAPILGHLTPSNLCASGGQGCAWHRVSARRYLLILCKHPRSIRTQAPPTGIKYNLDSRTKSFKYKWDQIHETIESSG